MNVGKVNRLVVVIVQDADAPGFSKSLNDAGFPHTRIPTRGGFLQHANEAVLVAHPGTRKAELMELIVRECHSRTEMQIVSMGDDAMLVPEPIEIGVGGATIFSVDLEHFTQL